MTSAMMPEPFQPIGADEPFTFACHPGVPCFTACCRELDLALTPYDVLRLKRALAIDSSLFLERYVLIERNQEQVFPTCYLTMVDDGRASCVFVTAAGCSVYADRPGSCRAYPVGRGVTWADSGQPKERLVLVREPHCQGFAETDRQTGANYLREQGLAPYNRCNDALLPLLQHPRVQDRSFRPNRQQLDQYMLALYDLDRFRRLISDGRLTLEWPLTAQQLQGMAGDDEALLQLGIHWLLREYFGG